MITEDYVSFDIAKLLKEKGFNEGCRQYWYRSNLIFARSEIWNRQLDNYEEEGWTAPTLQMTMKWLREVHKLAINIEFQIDSPTWKWRVYHIEPSEDKHTNFQHYNTYEEACEAGIRYCLENLI